MPTSTGRLSLQQPLTTDLPEELRDAITANAIVLDAAVLYETGLLVNRPAVVWP